MGVPKFYRWMSERYPCLSEVVKEYQIPEFDNLYLDMNGLIHPCAHPDDSNPHFRITEEKIFQDIFHYIEVLFRMIRPKKVFFMAVDGVAPRAKMNQQRGRRFRSAREAEDLVRKALQKGEVLPKAERFDSNCITPGTEFMTKLQEQLKYFVVQKISTDKAWQGIRVYLSGHQTPGEGEHKVMDFIRSEKSRIDYDPNTRHCLYGLDADLIMLGLATHEPHFSLLREEVRFGGKNQQKRTTTPEETTFHLLHLSLMREYLEFEFSPLKDTITFEFDIERVIDDWVLMGFLVGNDFIPHLPHMHIHQDALPTLWRIYMQVMPDLDGYLHEHGYLNLPRFEKYLTALSQEVDVNRFTDTYDDLKWLAGKTGKKIGKLQRDINKTHQNGGNQFCMLEDFEGDMSDLPEGEASTSAAAALDESPEDESSDTEESEEEDEDDLFTAEFKMHKANYYMEKLEYKEVTPDVLKQQARGYVKAIQWILLYYYRGCPSWSWFYEHHYAPYMSDVRDFSDMKVEFEYGSPFLPFQQLMAVLPAASKNLLPKAFQSLMIMDNSPVIEYYPVDFETDLNGKLQEWEAVVLIPFIEEKRLLKAMEPLTDLLTPEEKSRNSYGPCVLSEYAEEMQQPYPTSMPGVLPDVLANHCVVSLIPIDAFVTPPEMQRTGLCPGIRLDVYFPGFPTLRHIPHKAELKKEQVRVFQQNSRGDNMILTVMDDREPEIEQLSTDILGKSVFVSWPHLFEARVVKVSDDQVRFSLVDKDKQKGKSSGAKFDVRREELTEMDAAMWHRQVESLAESYHDRKGVEVGATFALLHAQPLRGRKYVCGTHGNIVLEKQWANEPVPYLYQTSIKDIAVKDPTFTQFKTLEDLFPVKSPVFMLANPSYGSMGQVLSVDEKNGGRIRIEVKAVLEPDLRYIKQHQGKYAVQYLPAYMAAQRLAINAHLVSRITGTLYVSRNSKGQNENPMKNDKVNIGLNLKFNKKNEEVPGYTKKTDEGWLYSLRAVQTIADYIKEFPQLFDFISLHKDEHMYFENEIFGEGTEELQKVSKYLKNLSCRNVQPMNSGNVVLDEMVVTEIQKITDRLKDESDSTKKPTKMQVRPHLLFRPLALQGNLVPDPTSSYELFDRVINVREGFSVPLGLRGTVMGILSAEKETDVLYEVVFDDEFMGGLSIRCSGSRAYRMPPNSLLNLSHGERKDNAKHKPTASKPEQQNDRPRNSNKKEQQSASSEFENMWHSLQAANLLPKSQASSSPHQMAAPGRSSTTTRGPPSLEQAANALNSSNLKSRGGQENHNNNNRYNHRNDSRTSRNHDAYSNKKVQNGNHHRGGAAAAFVHENTERHHMPYNSRREQQNGFTSDRRQQQQGSMGSGGANTTKSESVNAKHKAPMQKQNDEFSSMLRSLEISESKPTQGTSTAHSKKREQESRPGDRQTQHERDSQRIDQELQNGTDALREMLKIGEGATVAEPQVGPTPSHPYGKQLSLQELFQGAQTCHTQAPSTLQGAGAGSQNRAPTTEQEQPTPPRPQHHRSQVADLQMWCRSVGLGGPRYEYVETNRGCSAFVTLSNGLRFQGSVVRDRDMAAESAASVAMLSMQPHGVPFLPPNMAANKRPLLGPGGIMSSPNSAFTPVRSFGVLGMPVGPVPGPPGFQNPVQFRGPVPHFNMPPSHQQVRSQQQGGSRDSRPHNLPVHGNYKTGQQQQAHGVGHTAPPSDSHVNQSAPASKPNPFVPLQVVKQQITPQKSTKKEPERTESDSAAKSNSELSPGVSTGGAASQAYASVSNNSTVSSNSVQQQKQPASRNSEGKKQSRTPPSQTSKKSKSRLAIKFSSPPS